MKKINNDKVLRIIALIVIYMAGFIIGTIGFNSIIGGIILSIVGILLMALDRYNKK